MHQADKITEKSEIVTYIGKTKSHYLFYGFFSMRETLQQIQIY